MTEPSSQENRFIFKGYCFGAGGSNYSLRLHLLFPQQPAPWNRTRLLGPGESCEVLLSEGPFFAVSHGYEGDRLVFRTVSPLDLSSSSCTFGPCTVEYAFSRPVAAYRQRDRLWQRVVEDARTRLSDYTRYQLHQLEQSTPMQESLRLTHSVFYDFPFHPALQIPYVALAGRGKGLLHGVTHKQLEAWQSFFIRAMPQAMRECGYGTAHYLKVSREPKKSDKDFFFLYDTLAKVFSHMVSSAVQYRPDAEATFQKDYIGFNLLKGQLYGDCEDGAELLYSTLRLFRKIFPLSQEDLSRGSTSLCYHLSHWLQQCDLWLLQGAVGRAALDTHVWCAMFPIAGGPAHFFESTGLPEANFYKFVVRGWQVDAQGQYKDAFLVDPHSGKYGLGGSYLTHPSTNGRAMFLNWAKMSKQRIDKELDLANLLDCPLMHPMDILSGNFR